MNWFLSDVRIEHKKEKRSHFFKLSALVFSLDLLVIQDDQHETVKPPIYMCKYTMCIIFFPHDIFVFMSSGHLNTTLLESSVAINHNMIMCSWIHKRSDLIKTLNNLLLVWLIQHHPTTTTTTRTDLYQTQVRWLTDNYKWQIVRDRCYHYPNTGMRICSVSITAS